MSEHGHDSGFDFPHDGEHGRNCTGYGCDCDERNYGSRGHGTGTKSGGTAKGIYITIILALILGYGINELVGAIILIGVLFYILFAR